jgi:3-hydroxybutyrate dehydrogenase
MSLAGRTALVTGSTGGIGRGVAEALAAAGANVMLHGLEAEAGVSEATRLGEAYGVGAAFDGADLSHLDAITAMVRRTEERLGQIDILVNNAVTRHFAPVDMFPAEAWDRSLAVNLSAAFHLARLTVTGMRARRWGRIINMASVYSFRGAANRIDYVTTKTGLLGLTRALAIELARTGITCNAICPGTVASPAILSRIGEIAEAQGLSREQAAQDYIDTRHPSGRFAEAERVGALAAFLCSDAGSDITGASLPMDGGWLAG